MQRFKVDLTGDEPIFHGLSAADNGPLVYFFKAQSRISTLEAALRHEIDNCVNCDGQGMYAIKADGCEPEYRKCERCARARQALGDL